MCDYNGAKQKDETVYNEWISESVKAMECSLVAL